MKFVLKEIWDLGNLLPKLSRNPKTKSQDQASRKKCPDERTRGGHAPKRVASRHTQAAETRPKPRFRGSIVLSGDPFSWESCVGTLLPSAPINTPCSATEKSVQRQSQRAKSRVQVFFLQFRFSFLHCNFYFFLFVKTERR